MNTNNDHEENVVAPLAGARVGEENVVAPLAGARVEHVANPDDPPVKRPPMGSSGPWPTPFYFGLPGRTAIVQGQVFIVAVILIVQLWLITDALYELLSGQPGFLGWLALASGVGFVLALVVTFWPRRHIEEI